MNQMNSTAAVLSPSWQPDTSGLSREVRTPSPGFDLSVALGERRAPPVNKTRRMVSIVAAVGIQAVVIALILAAGVKIPEKVDPLMVVNITTQELKPEDAPPPPPTLLQPQVQVTLPFVPDVIQDVPPPPPQQVTAAITVAPKGS